MVENTAEHQYPNSILKRFRKQILWLYVISILISIPIIYATAFYQVRTQADKELSLLVDVILSLRKFVSEEVRPDLLKAGLYHSPAISSAVTTTRVAARFREKRPEYYFKVASDNPLNPMNKPQPLESKILARYRADSELDSIVEAGIIDDQKYLVSSLPSRAKKGCLTCHGDPRKAPDAIKSKYGTDDGYHYSVGNVVGAMVVGVPLSNINALVLQRAIIALGILTVLFGAIFLVVSRSVKRQIIQPVSAITDMAIAISKSDFNRQIEMSRDGSEIGELAHAMGLMQRSLAYSMKQLGS